MLFALVQTHKEQNHEENLQVASLTSGISFSIGRNSTQMMIKQFQRGESMNRILIGILAILILIATRPIATVVADGDDGDGISLNCNLELAFDIFAPPPIVVEDGPTVTVTGQAFAGSIDDVTEGSCPLKGSINITQNSVNFFSLPRQRFVGRVDGTFAIDTEELGVVAGDIPRAWVFGPADLSTERVIGRWRSDDIDGRGTFNISLESVEIEVAPDVFVDILVGGGSFLGFIDNAADGGHSTVGGGLNNEASGYTSTVGGGFSNRATGDSATVGGGNFNTARGDSSTVSGGLDNIVRGFTSSIGGGFSNRAAGDSATVGGGDFNTANGDSSTVGGGQDNSADGLAATVPGGSGNSADGWYSFAAGRQAKANHDGTFVWADAIDRDFVSTDDNQFLIDASGGVGIGTNSPSADLHVAGAGGSGLTDPVELRLQNTTSQSSSQIVFEENNQGDNMVIRYHSSPDGSENGLEFIGFGEVHMRIERNSGNVGISNNNPSEKLTVNGNVLADDFLTASSIRWKTNVQPIEGALEKVQGLRGVSYDWKETGEHEFGLIAEEVGSVIPEAVAYEANGQDAKGVDYSQLVPFLIEAIKEQQSRIAALEEAMGVETTDVQTGLDTSMIWMIVSGLALLLVTPGLVVGYRRLR